MENEIKAELSVIGSPNVSVTKMKTSSKDDDEFLCPPYLLVLPAGTDIYKLRQTKYICHCVIQIQKYKPSPAQCTQCYRCQRFGHASRNCNLPPRCVKCTEPHPTKDCPKKDRNNPAQCCNCNMEHPSNYSKCAVRVKYIEGLKKKSEANHPIKINQPIRNTRIDGRSFANVAASKTSYNTYAAEKDQGPDQQYSSINTPIIKILRKTSYISYR